MRSSIASTCAAAFVITEEVDALMEGRVSDTKCDHCDACNGNSEEERMRRCRRDVNREIDVECKDCVVYSAYLQFCSLVELGAPLYTYISL